VRLRCWLHQVHERQSSDERDARDLQFSDDEDPGDAHRDDGTFPPIHRPDFRRNHTAHAHCSHPPTGNAAAAAVLHRRVESETFAPFRSLPTPEDFLPSRRRPRDRPAPEAELTDCSSCSSVGTSPERHAVPTHRADSAHKLDTAARDDDDDDDDEIINVVDDLVT